MTAPSWTPTRCLAWLCAIALVACGEPPVDPTGVAPSLHRDGGGHRTIVVDPNGRHDATTIQAGIDMAPAGGRVQVRPGTYDEAIVISKGLTLEGVGRGHDDNDEDDERGRHGRAIVAPSGAPAIAVHITATDPVTIRKLTVIFSGTAGIRGDGIVDLTVENVSVSAINPPIGVAILLVSIFNNPPTPGPARLVVRESNLDGNTPFANSPTPAFAQTFGIGTRGVVDGVLEGNTIRRAGGACINVQTELEGEVHVDILNNDLDECYPMGRAGALTVGPRGTLTAPLVGFTATGTVNVVGNTIRNTLGSCLTTAGINYEAFSGRIEHNRVLGVVQECATATTRVLPAGIWVGSFRGATPASVTVRFNDIVGNAHAGLRVASNITTPFDASCNYWGSRSGPTSSAWPNGTGDAVVVEAGGATPMFTPFAKRPIARANGRHGEDDDDDDKRRGCGSEWSQPVNLGAVINTAASERNESLSPDELSLYFTSDRPGGQGLTDIYVSRRASLRSPWRTPVNLGTVINTAAGELTPSISSDGHWMYFNSDRAGGFGGSDIYVSYRADTQDDFAWGSPVNVGPFVNTAAVEQGSEYVPAGRDGIARLYFDRRSAPGATAPLDIYSVPLTSDGRPSAPAAPIVGVNLPDPVNDFGAELSSDGRELFFISSRPGGLGVNDIWRSTRRTENDPWSTPENLGSTINTALNDRHPSLSGDGRTLMFASTGHGGFGSEDLFTSTRTRIGHGRSHVARH